jgi:hypothetical protein
MRVGEPNSETAISTSLAITIAKELLDFRYMHYFNFSSDTKLASFHLPRPLVNIIETTRILAAAKIEVPE